MLTIKCKEQQDDPLLLNSQGKFNGEIGTHLKKVTGSTGKLFFLFVSQIEIFFHKFSRSITLEF